MTAQKTIFPFILLGLIPLGIIAHYAKKDIQWDLNRQHFFPQSYKEADAQLASHSGVDYLTGILQELENDRKDTALERITAITVDADGNALPDSVKKYLNTFADYWETKEKKRNLLPLINGMDIIKSYYEDNRKNESEAIDFSEIIPFYCIKNSALKTTKPIDLVSVCDDYLSHAMTNHITQRTAAIICLRVRSAYRADGLFHDASYLKSLQEKIRGYQQAFPLELGGTPKYKEEADYLNNFYERCEYIRNHFFLNLVKRPFLNDKIALLGA